MSARDGTMHMKCSGGSLNNSLPFAKCCCLPKWEGLAQISHPEWDRYWERRRNCLGLEVAASAATVMSEGKESYSLVAPLLAQLLHDTQDNIGDTAQSISQELKKRYARAVEKNTLYTSSTLDPKFKLEPQQNHYLAQSITALGFSLAEFQLLQPLTESPSLELPPALLLGK